MQKFLFLLFSLPFSLLASDSDGDFSEITDKLTANAVDLFNTLVTLAQEMRWVFAIIPVVAILVSIMRDISKIKEKRENMMQQEGSLKGEEIFNILLHVVIVVVSFFLLYGIFGLTYANAESMSEVWNILVFSFWKNIF